MPRTMRSLLRIGLVLVGIGSVAWGVPRFSLAAGEGCATCHVNPAGQGLRNAYGVEAFGSRQLPRKRRAAIKTAIADFLRVGGDVRVQPYAYIDFLSADVQTGASGSTQLQTGIFPMQVDLYAHWKLSDRTAVYVETDVLNQSSEVFGLWSGGPGKASVKLGKFLPNYGLRIDDHTAYIRGGSPRILREENRTDGLIWGPNYTDGGIELTTPLAGFQWTLGVFNGNAISLGINQDPSLALLARVERFVKLANASRLWLGWNGYSSVHGFGDRKELGRYYLAGGFVGVGSKEASLLVEVDWAQDYLARSTPSDRMGGPMGGHGPGMDTQRGITGANSLALFLQGVWRPERGVYLLVRVEHFDPDLSSGSDAFWRWSAGAELFPVPYWELKPLVRFAAPQGGGTRYLELLFQTHWWF